MFWKPSIDQKRWLIYVILFLTSSIMTVYSQQTLACASCGSGGGDPLILYPNEDQRLYTSLGLQSIDHEVSMDGFRGEVFGPTKKWSTVVAFGQRFSPDFFVTLTGGYLINQHTGDSDQGFTDPSLMGRYTLLSQSFAKPFYPQIQGLLGYKHAVGRSIHGSRRPDLLDITSSGFSDIKAGFDVWYGMTDIKGGISYLRTVSLPRRESDGSSNENGLSHRWTVTSAYQYSALLKFTGGINRQSTETRKYRGRKVPDSEILDHSLFINADIVTSPNQTFRLSYLRTALLPSDYLTTASQSLSAAFLLTLDQ